MVNKHIEQEHIKYAIDKKTLKPCLAEYSERVNKNFGNREWTCPVCNHDVGIRKGELKVHHFYHLTKNNECSFYDLNAQNKTSPKTKKKYNDILSRMSAIFLKDLLSNNSFNKIIVESCDGEKGCNKVLYFDSSYNTTNTEYILEYDWINKNGERMRFDLARLDDGFLKRVYEIKDSHSTDELKRLNLPCEWFEFSAKELLLLQSHIENGLKTDNEIMLKSKRKYWKCSSCEDTHQTKILDIFYKDRFKRKLCFVCNTNRRVKIKNYLNDLCYDCLKSKKWRCVYCNEIVIDSLFCDAC